MTTFNFQRDTPSICIDCTPSEAAAFETHIADLDKRIAAAKTAQDNRPIF